MEQLLLFEESIEDKLKKEVQELKQSIDRIRKGQFAKIGHLTKLYDELYLDVEIIKSGICKQNNVKQKNKCEFIEFVLY